MGAELVLLTPGDVHVEQWMDAAEAVLGGGQVAEFHGGMREILGPDLLAVLTWWPPRVIENPRLVTESLDGLDPATVRWTDVSLIYGREERAREILARLAEATGGTVRERT